MDFGHVVTAMVTPFNDEGLIDFSETKKLIDYLIENGTDAVVIAGTTGESPTLSTDEKVKLFKRCVRYVNKRIPVIAGTGSNNTADSIQLTKKATELGVDGIMLVAPYYNKPSQKGLYEHFKEIAHATPLPIMIYNIPGRTAVHIETETLIQLARIKNIIAVKESSGSLEQMAEIISNTDDSFQLYTGDDSNSLPALAIGAKGVVSVVSQVIGPEMQAMISLFKEGKVTEAAEKYRALLPTMQAMFLAPNPTCVKYALNKIGLRVGSVRLPLVPLDEGLKKQLKEFGY